MRLTRSCESDRGRRELKAALGRVDGGAYLATRPSEERSRYLAALPGLIVETRRRCRRARVLSLGLIVGGLIPIFAFAASGDPGSVFLLMVALVVTPIALARASARRWSATVTLASWLVSELSHTEDLEALVAIGRALGTLEGNPEERLLLDALRTSLARCLSFLPADAPVSTAFREDLAALVEAGALEYVGYDGAPSSLVGFLITGLLALDSWGDPRTRPLAQVLGEAAREQRLIEAVLDCVREPSARRSP